MSAGATVKMIALTSSMEIVDDQDNDCSVHWRIASTSLHIIVLCHTLMCLRRVLMMLRSVSEVVLVQQQAGGVRAMYWVAMRVACRADAVSLSEMALWDCCIYGLGFST